MNDRGFAKGFRGTAAQEGPRSGRQRSFSDNAERGPSENRQRLRTCPALRTRTAAPPRRYSSQCLKSHNAGLAPGCVAFTGIMIGGGTFARRAMCPSRYRVLLRATLRGRCRLLVRQVQRRGLRAEPVDDHPDQYTRALSRQNDSILRFNIGDSTLAINHIAPEVSSGYPLEPVCG